MASDNAMDALNPGKSRKTTDCACSILFILCWAGMLYIAIMGFLHGDPDRLLYGLDYKFDQCGKLNTAAGRGITSLNVNVALTDGNGTKPILLGGRDHTSEPMYYAVAPGGTRFPASYAGICAGVCPNANLERIGYKPSEWVCTGKYYDKSNRPDLTVSGMPYIRSFTKAGVDSFVSDVESMGSKLKEQNAYLTSFFLFKTSTEGCPDTAANDDERCTICYPSYPTVSYGASAYCLPNLTFIAENKNMIASVLGDKFDLGAISSAADKILGSGGATTLQVIADAYTALPVILGCMGAAIIVGFIWAFLVRLFVKPMMVVTIIGVFIGLALGVWTLWQKANEMRNSALYGVNDNFTAYADVTMGFFAANAACLALYTIFILCFGRSIFLAIGVIVEASKALAAMPALLFVPVLPAVLTFGVFVYFVIAAFYIASTGELKMDGSGVAQIKYDDNLKGALAFHFFGCLWSSVLLNHVGWAIVGMSVVQWYFARDKSADIGRTPVLTASGRVLRYHFGSVVFGSLIVAIVKYIRYMMHFVKKYITPENAVCGSFIKCIWCCIDCCLRCFEKLLEFISRNAYIIVAVESESFCTSARHAFGFLVSNLGGLAMVQVIGDSFLFLGKAFVALVSTGIAAIILTQSPWYNLNTTSIILPCTIVFIGAWMIGSLFMGIFEMCIDTIFMSFLIDEDKKLGFADGALKAFIADASKGKGEKVTSSTKGKATTSAPNVKPTVQA